MFSISLVFLCFGIIAINFVDGTIRTNADDNIYPVRITNKEDLVLFCLIISDIHNLTVNWTKTDSGNEWLNDYTKEVNETTKNATYTILKGYFNQSGFYTCKFYQNSTPFFVESRSIEVNAQPHLEGKYIDTGFKVMDEDRDDRQNFLHDSLNAYEGDTVEMSFKFHSFPPKMNFSLMKTGEIPLENIVEHKSTFYAKFLTLPLSRIDLSEHMNFSNSSFGMEDIQQEDVGTYAVVACNEFDCIKLYVIIRVKSHYDLFYPFLGIIAEALLVALVIMICEMRRKNAEKRGKYTIYDD